MADTRDLKSRSRKGSGGSSPSIPTKMVVDRWVEMINESKDNLSEDNFESLWRGMCWGIGRKDLATFNNYIKYGFPRES